MRKEGKGSNVLVGIEEGGMKGLKKNELKKFGGETHELIYRGG